MCMIENSYAADTIEEIRTRIYFHPNQKWQWEKVNWRREVQWNSNYPNHLGPDPIRICGNSDWFYGFMVLFSWGSNSMKPIIAPRYTSNARRCIQIRVKNEKVRGGPGHSALARHSWKAGRRYVERNEKLASYVRKFVKEQLNFQSVLIPYRTSACNYFFSCRPEPQTGRYRGKDLLQFLISQFCLFLSFANTAWKCFLWNIG